MFEEINPAAMVMAIVGGLVGVLVSGGFAPSLLTKIVVFCACIVTCYIVCNNIFEG